MPMKQLVIDRLDGKYAICTDSDQKFYAIELPELPQGPRRAACCASPTRGSSFWMEATPAQGPQGKRGGKKR